MGDTQQPTFIIPNEIEAALSSLSTSALDAESQNQLQVHSSSTALTETHSQNKVQIQPPPPPIVSDSGSPSSKSKGGWFSGSKSKSKSKDAEKSAPKSSRDLPSQTASNDLTAVQPAESGSSGDTGTGKKRKSNPQDPQASKSSENRDASRADSTNQRASSETATDVSVGANTNRHSSTQYTAGKPSTNVSIAITTSSPSSSTASPVAAFTQVPNPIQPHSAPPTSNLAQVRASTGSSQVPVQAQPASPQVQLSQYHQAHSAPGPYSQSSAQPLLANSAQGRPEASRREVQRANASANPNQSATNGDSSGPQVGQSGSWERQRETGSLSRLLCCLCMTRSSERDGSKRGSRAHDKKGNSSAAQRDARMNSAGGKGEPGSPASPQGAPTVDVIVSGGDYKRGSKGKGKGKHQNQSPGQKNRSDVYRAPAPATQSVGGGSGNANGGEEHARLLPGQAMPMPPFSPQPLNPLNSNARLANPHQNIGVNNPGNLAQSRHMDGKDKDNVISAVSPASGVHSHYTIMQQSFAGSANFPGVPAATVGGHTGFLLPEQRLDDLTRKCVIIDLDETLVHSSFKPVSNADFIVPVEIDGQIHQVFVLKRPHVDEFLQRLGQWFECILFTASLAKYADPVADLLDKWGVFRARLFRDACVFYKGNYVKDLDRIGRPIERTVIVDNSPASYGFHPQHAVAVTSWFDDMNDTELLDMLPLFEALYHCDNIFDVLSEYASQRQSRLMGVTSAQQTAQQLQAASAEQAAQLGVALTVPITSPPPAVAQLPTAPPPPPHAMPTPAQAQAIAQATQQPAARLSQTPSHVIHSAENPRQQLTPTPPAPVASRASTGTLGEVQAPVVRKSSSEGLAGKPESASESESEEAFAEQRDESNTSETVVAISEKFPFSPPPIIATLEPLASHSQGSVSSRSSLTPMQSGQTSMRTSSVTLQVQTQHRGESRSHSELHEPDSPSGASVRDGRTRQSASHLLGNSAGGGELAVQVLTRPTSDSSTPKSTLKHHSMADPLSKQYSSSSMRSSPPNNSYSHELQPKSTSINQQSATNTASASLALASPGLRPSSTVDVPQRNQPGTGSVSASSSAASSKSSTLRASLGKSAPPYGKASLELTDGAGSSPGTGSNLRSASQNCLPSATMLSTGTTANRAREAAAFGLATSSGSSTLPNTRSQTPKLNLSSGELHLHRVPANSQPPVTGNGVLNSQLGRKSSNSTNSNRGKQRSSQPPSPSQFVSSQT